MTRGANGHDRSCRLCWQQQFHWIIVACGRKHSTVSCKGSIHSMTVHSLHWLIQALVFTRHSPLACFSRYGWTQAELSCGKRITVPCAMCHVPLYACGSTFLQRSSTPIHLPLYACGSIFLQHSPTPIHLSVPPPRRRVSNVSLSLCIVCQGRVINLASPAGSRSEVRGPGAESDGRRNKILVQARKGHSYGYLSLEFIDQMTLLWTDIIVTCHKLLCSRKLTHH
jgi:hypothetical protein